MKHFFCKKCNFEQERSGLYQLFHLSNKILFLLNKKFNNVLRVLKIALRRMAVGKDFKIQNCLGKVKSDNQLHQLVGDAGEMAK